jgi:type IV secretory pathway VirB10-like protein
MSSTASPVSALANVLLDHEHPRQLDPGLEQDPRLRPRRNLRGLVTLLVLSLVIHGLLIRFLPKWEHPIVDSASPTQGPLQVTMTPPAAADRAPPPLPTPPVKTPPRTVIAANKPSPSMPPVFVPPDPPPKPAREETAPQPLDFAAALEARRAQRQAQENVYAQQNADARRGEREMTTAEKAEAAFKRNAQTLGAARDGTSGIFQIKSKGSR